MVRLNMLNNLFIFINLYDLSRVHCDLETTLDDAKKTQKELEKIEKMFRSSMAARKYKPFTS